MAAQHPLQIPLAALPDVIPLFPLPGAMLFPQCHLPLNLFEYRYVHMGLHALAQQRLIGMIQPKHSYMPDDEDENSNHAADEAMEETAPPALYPVGCAGKIVYLEETADERLLVTLKGLLRFRVIEELPQDPHGFRLARVAWDAFAGDVTPVDATTMNREQLLHYVKDYANRLTMDVDLSDIQPIPTPLLVNVLAMTLPFDPRDKQALLEAADAYARCDMLQGLLQMETLSPHHEDTMNQ